MDYKRLYSPADTRVTCKVAGEEIDAAYIAAIIRDKFLKNDIFLQEGDHFILGNSQYFIVLISPVIGEELNSFKEIQFTIEVVEM